MCAAKKKEEIHEPTLLGLILGVIIGLLIGLSIAVANLATQTVDVVKEAPEPEKRLPKMVYFVSGRDTGSNFNYHVQNILQGKDEVALSESDLNAWAKTTFKPDPAAKKEEASSFLPVAFKPAPPTFRVYDETLQIGSVLDVTVKGRRSIVFQAHGDFAPGAKGPRFVPEKMHIGRCPVPNVFGIQPLVLKLVGKSFTESEGLDELKKAYAAYDDITIQSDNLLVLKK